jgi:hypothetical protein
LLKGEEVQRRVESFGFLLWDGDGRIALQMSNELRRV